MGVAGTVSVAKLASRRAKPDGVLVVPPDEVIAYLEHYAESVGLPVELNSDVDAVDRGGDEGHQLEVGGRAITADQLVVATGPFKTPYVPNLQ